MLEYKKKVYKLFKKLERTVDYYINDEENYFLDDYLGIIFNQICEDEYELVYELFWDFQKYVEMYVPNNSEIYEIYEEISLILLEEAEYEENQK